MTFIVTRAFYHQKFITKFLMVKSVVSSETVKVTVCIWIFLYSMKQHKIAIAKYLGKSKCKVSKILKRYHETGNYNQWYLTVHEIYKHLPISTLLSFKIRTQTLITYHLQEENPHDRIKFD